MKRVAVLGSGGAGKTWLANELGRRPGLPVVHLDCMFWAPGWTERPGQDAQEELRTRWPATSGFSRGIS